MRGVGGEGHVKQAPNFRPLYALCTEVTNIVS